jgi:hypothetical protein
MTSQPTDRTTTPIAPIIASSSALPSASHRICDQPSRSCDIAAIPGTNWRLGALSYQSLVRFDQQDTDHTGHHDTSFSWL